MTATFKKLVIVYGENMEAAELEAASFANSGGLSDSVWVKEDTEARCIGMPNVDDWKAIKERFGF